MVKQNIEVRVRTVIFDENGSMLVQHHLSSENDFYRLPGGGVKFREKLEDCVVREIKEETGLDVKVNRLLWVRDFLDQFPGHSIEFFFLAAIKNGEFQSSLETETENHEFLFMELKELERVAFYPKGFIPKLKNLRDSRDFAEKNPYVRSVN